MPPTGFASSFAGSPLTTPWRQGPLPPSPPVGKVGADAAVLGGVVCRITAHKAKRPFSRLGKLEAALYVCWDAVAVALTSARAAQLPAMLRDGVPPGFFATLSFKIGAAMPLLAAVEIAVAFGRFRGAVAKRGRLDARLRDSAADHKLCEAALRRRLASRTEAAPPAERAMRRQQRQALRDDGYLDAFLAHRQTRAERGDCGGKLFSSGLTMARDGIVQSGAAGFSAIQVLGHLFPLIATALPWTGIAGCAASMAMSAAHVVTGVLQLRDSGKQRAALHRRRELLRRSPLAAALAGLERNGAAATVCKAQPLSARQQAIVGEADPGQLRQTATFYRTAMQYCDGRLGEAIDNASREGRNAKFRIAYGAGTLAVNGTVLGLTVAALTTLTAATAGMGLAVAGAALGMCWLGFAVYKMYRWYKCRRALQAAARTARRTLRPAGGNDAATAKAIGTACAQLDAGNANTHRHLIATRVIQHLQARGSAQALAERSMARALMRTLGADAEVVAAIEAAQTPEQCRLALKLVQRHLDGRCIDPARAQQAAPMREADGASTSPEAARYEANHDADHDANRDAQGDDARTPLLRRMADSAGAGLAASHG